MYATTISLVVAPFDYLLSLNQGLRLLFIILCFVLLLNLQWPRLSISRSCVEGHTVEAIIMFVRGIKQQRALGLCCHVIFHNEGRRVSVRNDWALDCCLLLAAGIDGQAKGVTNVRRRTFVTSIWTQCSICKFTICKDTDFLINLLG
jgi:hypothetical protein